MLRLLLPLLLLSACSGPEAPDAALCRDVISRLCAGPRCGVVEQQLAPGVECNATLTVRVGCGVDDFTFTEPTRARVLSCRLPLVRQGTATNTPPNCDDVAEMFTNCPDVVRLLGGTQ